MAKKFAKIQGFGNIYAVENNEYIISEPHSNDVNKNTICFVIADSRDEGIYVGNYEIHEGDKFIIAQNDIYSYVNSDSAADTWRPIYVNENEVAGQSKDLVIEFDDGNYTNADYREDLENDKICIKYDIDINELMSYIQEHIEFPDVNDGQLDIYAINGTAYTANPIQDPVAPNTQSLESNTVKVALKKGVTGTTGTPFSANTADNFVTEIQYTGNSDRLDWYVENEQSNDENPNNATAKKFAYIEGIANYFNATDFPQYISVKSAKRDIIAPETLVFVTCGANDASTFGNPEYQTGARFIWHHGKMFSVNSWMPMYTRRNAGGTGSDLALNKIDPIATGNITGGSLIIEGKGGILVDHNVDASTHARTISIDGSQIAQGAANVLAGDAINLNTTAQGKEINVTIKTGLNTTEESSHPTNKNFLHFTNDGGGNKTLLVNGIDSKAVFIEEDIPIGGTIVGNHVLESHSFADVGNVVPKGMSLWEALHRILYGRGSLSSFYIGVVGPYENVLTFEQDQDYTTIVTSNILYGDTADDHTVIAFRKYDTGVSGVDSNHPKSIFPSAEFKDARGDTPEHMSQAHQLIVLAPYNGFDTENIDENEWITVLGPMDAHWESAGHDDPYADFGAKWITTVNIDGEKYYAWTLTAMDSTKRFPVETEFRISFNDTL